MLIPLLTIFFYFNSKIVLFLLETKSDGSKASIKSETPTASSSTSAGMLLESFQIYFIVLVPLIMTN